MNSTTLQHGQEHLDSVFLYALRALPSHEISVVEAQIAACAECRQEMQTLRPIVRSFVSWPIDVLRPADSLWDRLAQRIANETGIAPLTPPEEKRHEPEWNEVASGVHVKLLSSDVERDIVSLLVRLDPGTDYPGHSHAGIEELHLLHGELKVDQRTLYPGDFIHAEPNTIDYRVWSATGCTCFLMTSAKDKLF
jgi:anti-sigma factor ChrR (cupin superfamily)